MIDKSVHHLWSHCYSKFDPSCVRKKQKRKKCSWIGLNCGNYKIHVNESSSVDHLMWKSPTNIECQTVMLLTVYVKHHSSFWSISNSIIWHTFVLAVVLRPLHILDGVMIVTAVYLRCISQIKPVLWHLWFGCCDVTCECYWSSLCDGIISCTCI